MTETRKSRLKSVSNDRAYLTAIEDLFNQPRRFITRYMRTFSVPDFSTELEDLPKKLKPIPAALKDKFYFDAAAKPRWLHFVGVMTEAERDVLLGLLDRC